LRRRWHAVALGAAAALLSLWIPWILRVSRASGLRADETNSAIVSHNSAKIDTPSIALLPFRGLSGEPDYLLDGMTDGVINALGRSTEARVISRQSAMHFKNTTKSRELIAQELGVDYLVDGVVERRGTIVSVSIRVWGERPMTTVSSRSLVEQDREIPTIQRRVALSILETLPTRSRRAGVMATTTSIDPSAYEAYLKGRYHTERFVPAGIDESIRQFELAISHEPMSGFHGH
jgi:TolB-like protein